MTSLSLGERIAKIRGGLSQQEFADRLGVSRNTLVRYEKDQRVPDATFLKRIVDDFGVAPGWLLMGAGEFQLELTPREAALLDNYRHSPERAKRNLETTSALLAQSGDGDLKDAG